jgi:hypothetical protein
MLDELLMQIGLPRDICYHYFFLIRDCRGVQNDWLNWLSLATDIGVVIGVIIGGYYLVKKIGHSRPKLQGS